MKNSEIVQDGAKLMARLQVRHTHEKDFVELTFFVDINYVQAEVEYLLKKLLEQALAPQTD
jgi:hypothetical protein